MFRPLWKDEEPRTISATVGQGIGYAALCWDNPDAAGQYRIQEARETAGVVVREIEAIVTTRLAQLLDQEGAAREWNAAVEECIRAVEAVL